LACDLVVASEDAFFQTVGATKGWFCTLPMLPLVTHLGRKRAFEVLFTGEPIPARKALDWGLVNRVVPPEALLVESLSLLRAASSGPFEAQVRGKAAFYEALNRAEPDRYDWAINRMTEDAFSEAGRRRILGFRTKLGR
jgi:enoyl-CoA hydratase/carnithine racemase